MTLHELAARGRAIAARLREANEHASAADLDALMRDLVTSLPARNAEVRSGAWHPRTIWVHGKRVTVETLFRSHQA